LTILGSGFLLSGFLLSGFLLSGFLLSGFLLFLLRCTGVSSAVVGTVKAAPLEKDGHGVEDAACLTFAARTAAHRLLIESLSSLEMEVANATFILVYGHTHTLTVLSL